MQHKPIFDNKHLRHLAIIAILGLAAALRLWRLDGSPLWWDEGNNAYLAHQSLGDLLRMSILTHDTDPPAHRLALKVWLAVWGDGAVQLRSLSALCSVLTVWLVYDWGKKWEGINTGLLASLLLAVSPFAVYYGREAKGYAFVGLLSTASTYVWAQYVDREDRCSLTAWLAYVLCGILALGAHYYAILVPVAQMVWLLADSARRRDPQLARRRLGRWMSGQTVIGLLLLPWVWLTARAALNGAHGVPIEHGALDLLRYLRHTLLGLAAGPFAQEWLAGLILVGLAAPITWICLRGATVRRALLATLVTVPLALGFIVQQVFPFQHARFFIYVVPPACILVAAGLLAMPKARIPLVLLLLVGCSAVAPRALGPNVPPEEDMRPLAYHMRQYGKGQDGIVVGYIWQEGILRMNLPGPHDYYLGWYTPESAARELASLLSKHQRLWLVSYRVPQQHPSNPAGWWLEQHAARGPTKEHGTGRAALYLQPPDSGLVGSASFEKGLYVWYARADRSVRPGDAITLELAWEKSASLDGDYTVYLHLIDPHGIICAQADGDPQNGFAPLSALATGKRQEDARALVIPRHATPGEYVIRLGVYDRNTGARLTVATARGTSDGLIIGHLRVLPGEQ